MATWVAAAEQKIDRIDTKVERLVVVRYEIPTDDVIDVAETDPALVAFQMDLFWVVAAGKDPVAIMEAHPGRFPLVHVKDRTADGTMVNVGAGAIDFRRIFAASERAGLRHAVIEHDTPPDPLAFARASIAHLRTLRG